MKLMINGKEDEINIAKLNVTGLLKLKNVLMPEMVSVELNGEILDRAAFDETEVKEGDRVEFLYFMGGGSGLKFSTRALHAGDKSSRETGATAVPIYNTAAFAYDSAQDLADVFDGRKYGHVYSRISNPTVAAFEQRVNALEQGRGAIAASSGMAAIATVVLTLAGQGDEIVAAKSLFGGTLLFFGDLLSRLGVSVKYADTASPDSFKSAVTNRTKLIFAETIPNPRLDVPDIRDISAIAAARNVPLVVDSTVTTPCLFEAKKYGVAIAVHSATKYMTGNGTAVGGILVDTGAFDWKKSDNPLLIKTSRHGDFSFLAAARKQVLQNAGGCLSPFNAFMHCLGIETLPLRMEKHCANAAAIASHFSGHKKVGAVNYPGLDFSPYRKTAAALFNNRFGGMLTLTLSSREKCFDFLGRLKLVKNLANIGDAKTLAIHPASTIFRDCRKEEMEAAGVTEELVRVSVGIEDTEDIIDDFEQALL